MIKPVFENEADEEVVKQYQLIKKALNSQTVPLFFCYIGRYPEYLSYITNQLATNLQHPTFIDLVGETKNTIISIVKNNLKKSSEINNWLKKYKFTPSYYSFQEDLNKIISVNVSLTFIFIALREAVKGWALAAKKLDSTNKQKAEYKTENKIEEEFIQYDLAQIIDNQAFANKITLNPQNASIVKNNSSLEKQLLPEYLNLCRISFNAEMKKSYFWTMRLGFEKIFLLSLQRIPELIFSPVNVVYRLADKYPDFSDLLYLLSEHFPTYAMHRMIYSAYLLE